MTCQKCSSDEELGEEGILLSALFICKDFSVSGVRSLMFLDIFSGRLGTFFITDCRSYLRNCFSGIELLRILVNIIGFVI